MTEYNTAKLLFGYQSILYRKKYPRNGILCDGKIYWHLTSHIYRLFCVMHNTDIKCAKMPIYLPNISPVCVVFYSFIVLIQLLWQMLFFMEQKEMKQATDSLKNLQLYSFLVSTRCYIVLQYNEFTFFKASIENSFNYKYKLVSKYSTKYFIKLSIAGVFSRVPYYSEHFPTLLKSKELFLLAHIFVLIDCY